MFAVGIGHLLLALNPDQFSDDMTSQARHSSIHDAAALIHTSPSRWYRFTWAAELVW